MERVNEAEQVSDDEALQAQSGDVIESGQLDASHDFFVVGIGASAGGFAALKRLFTEVTVDSGLAYVIVVHLSPEHESHLAELLQPHLAIPIQQVTQTVLLEPNHAYLIPPNANLDTIDTHLRLSELEARRQERAPIDHFLRTLAETHENQAIGVILTGTGSDGTLGLRRIKERGGLAVVQDPAEAEYDGMPQSAISATPVDLILPLDQIFGAVLEFARTEPRLSIPEDSPDPDSESRQFLSQVFGLVRARTGRDFTHYKRSTLVRRIARRMQFNHVREPSAYLALLRRHPAEVQSLADDLLITVTSFFRDTNVFEALQKEIVPTLFDGKGTDDTIRVWSAGCATGEEAYSLAMLLLEAASARESSPSIQVFASDLHPASLQRAREGFYPGDIETDVSPERINAFFQKQDGGYRVRREVRELVTFAPHNVLADPPFSRIDLISCRNLLIYLRRDLQQLLAELFHYALNKNGYLILGTSESIDVGELFKVADKKSCIYRKRNVPAPEPRLPVFPVPFLRTHGTASTRATDLGGYGALHKQLVEELGPPSVLVTPDDNVAHFSNNAGRFMVHPPGEPTTNVFKLVRAELRVELRTALSAARRGKRIVRTEPIAVRFDGDSVPVALDIRPTSDSEHDGFALVLFEERPDADAATENSEGGQSDDASAAQHRKLAEDKLLAEQRLQVIIEEYETSQEEIKASNEELQSANEELRSTLEELETSKEELQSMNEELQTVNQENRHKVDELSQLSNDLQNLLAATDIATLFLDRELRILRFTPRITELFNVRMTDRGRSLSDFTSRLGYDGLASDAADVLKTLVPVEREICDESERWYLTRLLPYRSCDDRIAGIVITFVEITQRRNAEDQLRSEKEYSERIIESLPEPLLVLTSELTVRSANAAFYDKFQLQASQTVGDSIFAAGSGHWDIPQLRELLEDVLPRERTCSGYQIEHDFGVLGRKVLLLNGRCTDHMILLGIHDITDRFEAEQALRSSQDRLNRMINVAGVGVVILDVDDAIVDANDTALELLGYGRESLETRRVMWLDLTPPEAIEASRSYRAKLRRTGHVGPYEQQCVRRDGSRTWLLFAGASLGDGTTVEYCVDINDRKRAEQALRASEEQLATELTAMKRLHSLVARLLVCKDMGSALDDVLIAAMEIAGTPMGQVQLFDARRQTLEMSAHRGLNKAYLDLYRSRNIDDAGAYGAAFTSGERVIVENVADDTWEESRAAAELAGYTGFQATPLMSRSGETLGVLSTNYPAPYRPGDSELRLLDLYARQAADFIERIRADAIVRDSEARLGEENRNKDEYLAMLGHELRNPLSAIRNATELLLLVESEEPRVRRACRVLKRQSNHVARIIDGLLEVSRIARGKIDLQLEPVDIREIVERVLQDTSSPVARGGLELVVELGSEPLYVNCDEVRLVQVLDNLIGNAAKFTPAPGTIAVKCEREGAHALIRVRDTGVGIRAEMLERIFDAFRQEHQSPERSQGGLGLGLSLAKGLTELHGGRIEARSAGPGTGSEFTIRLPLTSRRNTDRPTDGHLDFVPRRLLVVEDNPDAAQMLVDLLDVRGHQVTAAADGMSALEILREHGADLVLCDLGLPGMHGHEFAKQVRADSELRHIPLVALTGYGQSADVEQSRAAGFDEHLVKPVELPALDVVLERLGGGRPRV